jgi:NADH-quinone oxidoreductase subunit J
MTILFYIAALVAVVATALVITRVNAIHALLYFIVSLFAVALVFFTLGAPFVGILEIIVYAGAIMVLFVFVVMLLNLGPAAAEQERGLFTPGVWWGPAILAAVLFLELLYIVSQGGVPQAGAEVIGPGKVGAVLLGPYLLGVEIASMLLLAGLIGAYHLGRQRSRPEQEDR